MAKFDKVAYIVDDENGCIPSTADSGARVATVTAAAGLILHSRNDLTNQSVIVRPTRVPRGPDGAVGSLCEDVSFHWGNLRGNRTGLGLEVVTVSIYYHDRTVPIGIQGVTLRERVQTNAEYKS
jgi:hypothetical protein